MNNWFRVQVNEILCTGMSNSEIGIFIRYKALCEHFKVNELTWQQIKFNFDNKERKVVSKLFGISPEVSPKFDRSLTEVSPKLVRSSTEVCPKCDSKNNDLDNPLYIDKTRQDKTKKDNLTVIQKEKRKFLVPDDWMPKDETKLKLQNQGLDVPKVVAKFINSCQAKGLKYIDHDRAILSWDWSKDASLTAKANDDWGDYWAEMEKKWEAKHEQAN